MNERTREALRWFGSAGSPSGPGRRVWERIAADIEAGRDVSLAAQRMAEAVLGRPILRLGVGVRPDFLDRQAGDASVGPVPGDDDGWVEL